MKHKQVFILPFLLGLTFFSLSCGPKKRATGWKQVRVEITGLDGNGQAEEHIREALFAMDGIKTISFNYLEDEVIVLYDTVQVSSDKIIDAIGRVDGGRHRILEHHDELPQEKKETAPPDTGHPDIGDDVDFDGQV